MVYVNKFIKMKRCINQKNRKDPKYLQMAGYMSKFVKGNNTSSFISNGEWHE